MNIEEILTKQKPKESCSTCSWLKDGKCSIVWRV